QPFRLRVARETVGPQYRSRLTHRPMRSNETSNLRAPMRLQKRCWPRDQEFLGNNANIHPFAARDESVRDGATLERCGRNIRAGSAENDDSRRARTAIVWRPRKSTMSQAKNDIYNF